MTINTGALIGATFEILVFLSMGVYFLYLHFKQESQNAKNLRTFPISRVIFKYKYSFVIFSILFFVQVLIDISRLLSRI